MMLLRLPVGKFLFKISNKDNRTFVDISSTYTAFTYSNPTMETPELWKKSIQIWSFMSFRCLS